MVKCPSLSKIQSTIMTIVNMSPIMLLMLIFLWSYYAYNFVLAYGLIKDEKVLQGTFFILFYHPVFFLCLWSYWTVCRTSPGYTIDLYKNRDEEGSTQHEENAGLLQNSEIEHSQRQPDKQIAMLNIEQASDPIQQFDTPQPITVKRDGAIRFCKKCNLEKLDRTHHCRLCNRCILKMDHHCPWINNCVGFHNYKSFYLFLVYASLYCVWIFATTLPRTIEQVNGPMSILGLSIHCALLVFISGIFGLFLVPFTIFHTRQLCKNRTTIEYYEKANYRLGMTGSRRSGNGSNRRVDIMRSKYFNPWDIGTQKNIDQVLGKSGWKKLIPIGKALGDGSSFPINSYAYDTLGGADGDLSE